MNKEKRHSLAMKAGIQEDLTTEGMGSDEIDWDPHDYE
jgi:hypothetical protein